MKTIIILLIAAGAFMLGVFMGVLIMGLCAASSNDDRETEAREARENGKR